MSGQTPEFTLENFPARSYDKLRLRDTGGDHVSNVVFVAFCETGRAEILLDPELSALTKGFTAFAARFSIDYRAELFWPGRVEIGTGIKAIGRSSVTFAQALFQNGKCVATAEAVHVQVNNESKRPAPLSPETRAWLARFVME